MRRLTVLLLTFLATIRRGGWDGLVSIAETYRSSWNDIAAGHTFAAALTVSIWICETGTCELSGAPQSADRDDSGSSRRSGHELPSRDACRAGASSRSICSRGGRAMDPA